MGGSSAELTPLSAGGAPWAGSIFTSPEGPYYRSARRSVRCRAAAAATVCRTCASSKWCSVPTLQARETAHTRNRYGEPSVQADGVGSFGRPRTWAPATPVACKGPEPPREGGRDKPGTHAAAILARVCGGGRQGWRLPNCKGAVPTDSANCSCAPSLLVGVWGAAARSGGDVCRAIGGAEALKNSVLLPLAFPRSTPILMRSRLGCTMRFCCWARTLLWIFI